MQFDISFEAHCDVCYLQDHHNREGELLLGVYPTRTNAELAEDLYREAESFNYSWPFNQITKEEFLQMAKNASLYNDDQLQGIVEEDEALSYEPNPIWFLLTWKEEEENKSNS